MDKKLSHKNFLRKNFSHKKCCCKNKSVKNFGFYFCNIIFCIKIFCITIVCITKICTFIFDSKETTHSEINVQSFVTRKMLMQNFLSQKNACKTKSSKIFDYLVRVHNDKGLELCGRECTGDEPSFPSPTKGLINGLVPCYRLPYIPKLSSWSSSFIPSWYLPARRIPTLHHYGHELNSQIFLTN